MTDANTANESAGRDLQLPLSAKYAFTARTRASQQDNALGAPMISFMRADRISRLNDTWRVMHFEIYEDENQELRFKSRTVKDEGNFIQAMAQLAAFERAATASDSRRFIDLDPAKLSFLKKDFFVIEHFVEVAEREGVAFDRSGTPHVKHEGRIVSDGNFLVKDILRSEATESAVHDGAPGGIGAYEQSVLSQMFNGVAVRGDLNAALTGFNAMGYMDNVVGNVQTFWYSMQEYLGNRTDVDALIRGKSNVSREDEREIRGIFSRMGSMDKEALFENALSHLSVAETDLEKMEKIGVFAGDMKKFVAQCEVAAHLLRAQTAADELKERRGENTDLVERIERSAEAAEGKYRDSGATDGEVRLLKAAVLAGGKPQMPSVVYDFVRRYSQRRDGIEAKLKAMQKAGEDMAKAVDTGPNMPGNALVKPPMAGR